MSLSGFSCDELFEFFSSINVPEVESPDSGRFLFITIVTARRGMRLYLICHRGTTELDD